MMLRTKRLLIRSFRKNDQEDLYAYLSDPEVVRFEPYQPLQRSEIQTVIEQRINDRRFLAVALSSNKLIGNLYVAMTEPDVYEIGYVFNRAYWGQGYARESLICLIEYLFHNQKAQRIIASCDQENERSWRLLESCGLQRTAALVRDVYFFVDENNQPIWKDTYRYELLIDNYPINY
ncbi:hypothetical protein SDC9_85954 [bioreactor metagenome]|uniref:N-acetyltransferase domain-containing protein n=1 Tax=bioreactor metagenome TaxID=1076179 RepID=A0A644ZHN1_9ZZZZ